MIQWIYRIVITRLDKAKRLIGAEGLIETPAFAGFVSTDDIITRSGVWVWLGNTFVSNVLPGILDRVAEQVRGVLEQTYLGKLNLLETTVKDLTDRLRKLEQKG